MRYFFFSPVKTQLVSGKILNNKVLLYRTLSNCLCKRSQKFRDTKTFYSGRFECTQQLFSKHLFYINDKYYLFDCSKRNFSVHSKTPHPLMDMNVVMSPNFFQSLRIMFNSYLIKNFDKEFSIVEFLNNSKLAVSVVTNLIAEMKFSELDGLLTHDCKTEVEKNIKTMDSAERLKLAINVEDIMQFFPCQADIIKGKIFFFLFFYYYY